MSIKDLVVSSEDLLEGVVEEVVRDHFKYNENGEILVVNKRFWKLKGEEKILLYLAAVAGRKFLDIETPELGLDNARISKGLNMNKNSVRAYLSQLRTRGLIETEKGRSRVTTQGVHDLLEKEDKNHG